MTPKNDRRCKNSDVSDAFGTCWRPVILCVQLYVALIIQEEIDISATMTHNNGNRSSNNGCAMGSTVNPLQLNNFGAKLSQLMKPAAIFKMAIDWKWTKWVKTTSWERMPHHTFHEFKIGTRHRTVCCPSLPLNGFGMMEHLCSLSFPVNA